MKPWSKALCCAVLLAGCATSHIVHFDAPERRETVMLLFDRHGQLEERTVAAWREQDKKWANVTVYDGNGVLSSKAVYAYGPSGVVTQVERFAPDGSVLWRGQIDTSGKPGRVEVFNANGQLIPIPYEQK